MQTCDTVVIEPACPPQILQVPTCCAAVNRHSRQRQMHWRCCRAAAVVCWVKAYRSCCVSIDSSSPTLHHCHIHLGLCKWPRCVSPQAARPARSRVGYPSQPPKSAAHSNTSPAWHKHTHHVLAHAHQEAAGLRVSGCAHSSKTVTAARNSNSQCTCTHATLTTPGAS